MGSKPNKKVKASRKVGSFGFNEILEAYHEMLDAYDTFVKDMSRMILDIDKRQTELNQKLKRKLQHE